MTTRNEPRTDPVAAMDRTLVVVGRHLDAVVASRLIPVLEDMAAFTDGRIAEPDGFVVEAGGRRIVRRSDQATLARPGTVGQHGFRNEARHLDLHVMDHAVDADGSPDVLADAVRIALAAIGRIAARDRLVSEEDFAVVTECATELVLGPPVETTPIPGWIMPLPALDGIAIGTPWYPSSTNLPDGHPCAHDAATRHWTMARGLRALGVWMLDGRLTIGGVRRARVDPHPDPIVRMRRHERDRSIERAVDAMGLLDGAGA